MREPTIVTGMPMDGYLKADEVGSSSLKKILDSPADFKTALEQRVETKSMALGTAIHTAILEPHELLNRYLLQNLDWGPKNKLPGSRLWRELKETAVEMNRIPLPYEDVLIISRIKQAALKHKALQEILAGGVAELTGFAKGYKARTDWITSDDFIWDLKTTSKPVDDASLEKTIFNYGYHFQAAHHSWVMREAGIDVKGFGWIFVSTGTPYPHIRLKRATPELLEAGMIDHKYAMELYERSKEINEWPGYPDEIEEINLPHYAERDYE